MELWQENIDVGAVEPGETTQWLLLLKLCYLVTILLLLCNCSVLVETKLFKNVSSSGL